MDEPTLEELRSEGVEVQVAPPVAEALDEWADGHLRAEDSPEAAKGSHVSTRKDLHPPESPQQHDGGGPGADPRQRVQAPQRGLGGQALDLVLRQLPGRHERCDVPQGLDLRPAEADSGEARDGRRRDLGGLREDPGRTGRRVEASPEPLHEAPHEHPARLEAQLLVGDDPAEGLEQRGEARRPRAPQRPLELPKRWKAGSGQREARSLLEAEDVAEGPRDPGEARARDRAGLERELEGRGVDRTGVSNDTEEVLSVGREDATVPRTIPRVDDARRPPLQEPDGRFEVERGPGWQPHVMSREGTREHHSNL